MGTGRRILVVYLIAGRVSAFPGAVARLFSIELLEYNPRLPAAALMVNHVLAVAAFGFVAVVVIFVHPASHADRAARQAAAVPWMAAVGATDMRPHLAASK